MKHSELINKIHHGEEGFLYLPFDDFVTLAKVLLNRGYAIMITGGEVEDEYRIDWAYAGNHDDLDYANREMVVFGSNDFLEMLEFGDYEADEAEKDDRHGHWEIVYNDNEPFKAICSNCGYTIPISPYLMMKTLRECPNCKIKMEEVEE